MDIQAFVEQSIGQWRSQRSAHHLAFGHFEAIESVIDIVALSPEDPEVVALCQSRDVAIESIASPFRMTWEGQSDWNEEEVLSGNSVLIPVPDATCASRGKLLRDKGYAETMEAAGDYRITDEGMFILVTPYDRASAEEKIWFVNPNLRCRVSLIKTSSGTGAVTASFSSEIRQSTD